MLYRDEPMFRLPFALLNSLIEIDEQLGNFRYRHLQMVRRMIGSRSGLVEAAASNTCKAP
jgi:tryptophan 2,3-dioxygenase